MPINFPEPKPEDVVDERDLPVVAVRIQHAIMKSGLHQAEVGRRAGLSRDAMSRYAGGRTKPPREKLEAIANVFGLVASDLDPTLQEGYRPPKTNISPYRISSSASGDPGRVYLSLQMDMAIETMTEIIRLVGAEMNKNGRTD